ncbi:MAG: hypothetical protein ACLFTA_02710 [Candidatus Nanohaloarchaea archaeon]
MEKKFYRLMTAGGLSFLLTGLFLGLSSYFGVWFINLIGYWHVNLGGGLSSMLMMLSISSFLISPVIAAAFSLYTGYDLEDRMIAVISSGFTCFIGYFILNISAIIVLLQGVEQSTGLNSPYRIFYAFLGLENSVAFFSFPTLVVAMAAGYLGSDIT